ncbi:MAG: DNA polymerase IV [Pseudomonadota bacterium]
MPSLCRDCCSLHQAQLEKCPSCRSHRIVFHAELDAMSIAHIDCDAFYAAIHKRDDKSLANKPVIGGGGQRGVVATSCYLARASVVKSAMPMFQALKLCPDAVVLKPNMELYSQVGREVRETCLELTPMVEATSIDEAYLDLSGTERLHKAKPAVVLAKLAKKIEAEIGITISIGLATNKFLAKTASDMDKPRGFYVLSKADVPQILWPRDIGFLHGVGPATVRSFAKAGYNKIGDIAGGDVKKLVAQFGDLGLRMHRLANGEDNRTLEHHSKRKSISSETTFMKDIGDFDELWAILQNIGVKLARIARQKSLAGNTVSLKLKAANRRNITRQVTLFQPTQIGKTMLEAIKPLLQNEITAGPFRLIGLGLHDLVDENEADMGDLLGKTNSKDLALEKAIDTLYAKFGKTALTPSNKLGSKND